MLRVVRVTAELGWQLGMEPSVVSHDALLKVPLGATLARHARMTRSPSNQVECWTCGADAGLAPTFIPNPNPTPPPTPTPTPKLLPQVECWTYGVDAGLALLRKLVDQRQMLPDTATWNTLLAGRLGQDWVGQQTDALVERWETATWNTLLAGRLG